MIYTVTFNPAIDYVVRLDRPLEVGEVNRAAGEDCVLGGKGINVSGVLRELGCESVALGFVAGETGAWLERGLAAQGLRTDFIHLAEGMTRINVKIKAGTETELNGAGPSIPESAMQQLEAQLDTLQPDDILILAGSIPKSLSQSTYERLLAGAVFGIFLHRYIIRTVEVDAVMFGRNINPVSFLYCGLLTIGFSMIVNLFMHQKLKKIDMVESLKSVE